MINNAASRPNSPKRMSSSLWPAPSSLNADASADTPETPMPMPTNIATDTMVMMGDSTHHNPASTTMTPQRMIPPEVLWTALRTSPPVYSSVMNSPFPAVLRG